MIATPGNRHLLIAPSRLVSAWSERCLERSKSVRSPQLRRELQTAAAYLHAMVGRDQSALTREIEFFRRLAALKLLTPLEALWVGMQIGRPE